MPPHKNDPAVPQASEAIDPNAPLPQMTMAQLLAVITAATQQQSAAPNTQMLQEMGKTIAEAILESRKPMPDPKAEAQRKNDELFREQEREQQRRTKENRKAIQKACSHIAGSYGDLEDMHHRTSIAWHRNDVGVEVGICTGCNRIFYPDDPDYSEWRQKKSFCRVMSAAGPRTVFDHKDALEKTHLKDS